MKQSKLSVFIYAISLFLSCIFISVILSYCFFKEINIRYIFLSSIILPFTFRYRFIYWFLTLPFLAFFSIYFITGVDIGPIKYDYIAAIANTSRDESLSFLNSIPKKRFIISAISIFLIIICRFISKKIDPVRNRLYIFIVLSCYLLLTPNMLSKLAYDALNGTKEYINELRQFKQLDAFNNDYNEWGEITNNSSYEINVLFIGEMMRSDYLNVYGYNEKNTPFLSSINGTFVHNYYSADTHTVPSLRIMLTYQGENSKIEPNYPQSFINAANNAGYDTYWISNQGLIGDFDTPISFIAKNSKHKYFIRLHESDTEDHDMLKAIERYISNHGKKKKLIVVHLYDSHGYDSLCKQNEKFMEENKIGKYNNTNKKNVECYSSSAMKTDKIIHETYNILKSKKIKFSIVYFSDHGSSESTTNNGDIFYKHEDNDKAGYKIPLIRIRSDDTEKNHIYTGYNGIDFTHGLLNWLSIKSERINPSYDLFEYNEDFSSEKAKEKQKYINSLSDNYKSMELD
ncbi:hypothetical protein OA40_05640 [Morganella morganii]|nr:hypothetical protein OA40_05640 [Morganella morganii]